MAKPNVINADEIGHAVGLLVHDLRNPAATITANVSGKYEDRWVRLRRASDNCAFLKRAAVSV